MNRDLFAKLFAYPALAAALALTPALVGAQSSPATPAPPAQSGTATGAGRGMMMGQSGTMMSGKQCGKMAGRDAMMARHQEMMRQWKTMDANLDALIAEMNASHGQKKIDAMAAVLNELAAQRLTMRTMMREMRTEMMSSSTGAPMHARMMMRDGRSSSSCPMMKGAGSRPTSRAQSGPSGS
jgi:hypothetical protein